MKLFKVEIIPYEVNKGLWKEHDKIHASAKACWTNSIFTSTTINVLKGEANQCRLTYVKLMMWTIVGFVFHIFKLTALATFIGVMRPHMDDNIFLHQKLFNQTLDLKLVELISQGHCT